MSVSSVVASPAVVAPQPIETRQQDLQKTDDDNDSRLAPPPPRAALPPGQGTRIDQLA